MSEKVYIHDSHGSQIPLLDEFGNLSMQVIMLYSEDKLTTADRKVVDEFAATDEMSRDALDGFTMSAANASRTRHAVNDLNTKIQERSGAKAASPLMPKDESSFDYRKLAAAVALLVVIGGATFLLSQLWNKNELADNSAGQVEQETPKPMVSTNTETLSELTDSIFDEAPAQDKTLVVEEAKPKKTPTEADTKPFEEPNKAMLKEKKAEMVGNVNTSPQVEEKAMAMMDDLVSDTERSDEVIAAVKDDAKDLATTGVEKGLAGNGNIRSETAEEESALQKATAETERKREEQPATAISQQAQMPTRGQAAAYDADRSAPERGSTDVARYPGGDIKMYKFIEQRKNYPEALRQQGIGGNVTISFEVDPDGRVTNAKVKKGVNGILDEDALRVVRSMPSWTPAKENGNPIPSSRSVVIKYGD
ncbi:MAG: energy transducer TonB [Flavobacteriales bacterium]|nr:energy transducer TonB [Flavobacteriales bacterium]